MKTFVQRTLFSGLNEGQKDLLMGVKLRQNVNILMLQFLHLYNGDNATYLKGL